MSSATSRKAITPTGILSYPHLFKPQAAFGDNEGGAPKFTGVLVFPEGTDLSELERAVKVAVEEFFGDKAKTLLAGRKLRLPFRDDWEEKGYPENSIFITAKTGEKTPPQIVSRYADPKTGKPQVITDESEIYAGALARFSVSAYGYDVKGNKGVAFGLNNVQKMGDGDRLDGRTRGVDEFSAEAPLTADLDDLQQKENGGIDALIL